MILEQDILDSNWAEIIWYFGRINRTWLDIAHHEDDLLKMHSIIWLMTYFDADTVAVICVSEIIFLSMQICKYCKQRKFATIHMSEK